MGALFVTTLLGIDTGGTYTDAVLYDEARRAVLHAGKALTTKDDLARGIAGALDDVLPLAAPPAIGFVSLSTTLATNALVEGHGGSVCLVLIGQGPEALAKSGLGEALSDDPVVYIEGGHDATGEPQAALDLAAAREAVARHGASVDAIAVAGYFATRNPAHELAVRDLARELTGLPVTCSHELSSALDAPRRALTTLLNARLIPLLHELILAVQGQLSARGIDAPLMVVKGDGSMVSAEAAMLRPVETVLSGPAASCVGACHLTGRGDAFVADVGGTTTDIAFIADGRPRLAAKGATVGGWRTMVEAVDVHAIGLGGDSEVAIDAEAEPDDTGLRLGPRRVVPLSLLAHQYPHVVDGLRGQVNAGASSANAGCFALRARRPGPGAALSRGEQAFLDRLGEGPLDLTGIEDRYLERRSLERLLDRGLVVRAGFTPSDAAHLLDRQSQWSHEAAVLGARLWLRRAAAVGGRRFGDDETAFAARVVEQFVRQGARALAIAALAAEQAPVDIDGGLLGRAVGGADADRLLDVTLRLGRPLIGVGAAAEAYVPAVAARMNTAVENPRHAGVCNAVGAVAGAVIQRAPVLITQPTGEKYRAHLFDGVADFEVLEHAVAAADKAARAEAERLALAAGAAAVEVDVERSERTATAVDGSDIFVECHVTGVAVGRPRSAGAR